MNIVRISDTVVMVDNVRYIKSWKGTKVRKTTSPLPKQSRGPYMKAYRRRKYEATARQKAIFDEILRFMECHRVPLPS